MSCYRCEEAVLAATQSLIAEAERRYDQLDATNECLTAQRDRLVTVGKAAMDWMDSLPTEIHILMAPELSARLAEVYDDLRSVLRDIEGGA